MNRLFALFAFKKLTAQKKLLLNSKFFTIPLLRFLPLITTLFIFSCQKEISDPSPLPPDNNPPIGDSNLLTRFAWVNMDNPNDTIGIISIQYDNLNRATAITESELYNGTMDDFVVRYVYNGTDTLVQKYYFPYAISGTDTTWDYLTYNQFGEVISDTANLDNSSGAALNIRFTQTPFGYSSLRLYSSPNYDYILHYIQYDGRKNILNEVDTIYSSLYSLTDPSSTISSTYSFDNHPSPWHKVFPKRVTNLYQESGFFDEYCQVFFSGRIFNNNILTETTTVTGPINNNFDYDNEYTYTYRSDGYPLVVTKVNHITNTTLKGVYTYR